MPTPTPTTLEEALTIIVELVKRNNELEAENVHLRGLLSPDPSTPSGMTPPYKKPRGKRRRRRPGRGKGHPGSHRRRPDHVDERKEHRADCCPRCGGALGKPFTSRTRYTEDIPPIRPWVTEHVVHRYFCACCRKAVEAPGKTCQVTNKARKSTN
jgi:hypothetical protein